MLYERKKERKKLKTIKKNNNNKQMNKMQTIYRQQVIRDLVDLS